jgi:hypothetical protein
MNQEAQGNSVQRPMGIFAISVLMLAAGAVAIGVAILNLSLDMTYFASPAGATARYFMFGLVFSGLAIAGFGIALWEGLAWARSASLFVLSFFTTLKLFSVAAQPFPNNLMSTDAGVALICVASIFYLALPEARQFLGASWSHVVNRPMPVHHADLLANLLKIQR